MIRDPNQVFTWPGPMDVPKEVYAYRERLRWHPHLPYSVRGLPRCPTVAPDQCGTSEDHYIGERLSRCTTCVSYETKHGKPSPHAVGKTWQVLQSLKLQVARYEGFGYVRDKEEVVESDGELERRMEELEANKPKPGIPRHLRQRQKRQEREQRRRRRVIRRKKKGTDD